MQTKLAAQQPQTAQTTRAPHNLIVENRHTITATGVTRIVSYDESGATLETQQGTLMVGGKDLQVSELSIQTGELKIYGQIDYLQYSDTKQSSGGFFKRLVR